MKTPEFVLLKKKSVFFILLFLIGYCLHGRSQAPEAFKYQAIARDANGIILKNHWISIRICILEGNQEVYTEYYKLYTNAYGLIHLNVGQASNFTGDFSSINWGRANHFIQVDVDESGGENYKSLGLAQLLSVPYALYAKEAGNATDCDSLNEIQYLSLAEGTLMLSKDGGTVFLPDSSSSNEIQTLSLEGDSALILSKNGGSVNLPSKSRWIRNEDNLVYDNGNIGINTTNPLSKLSINDEGKSHTALFVYNDSPGTMSFGVQGILETPQLYNGYSCGVVGSVKSGYGQAIGIKGIARNSESATEGRAFGVCGEAGNATPGYNYGVFAELVGTNDGTALYACLGDDLVYDEVENGQWAGYFTNKVYIRGNLGIGTTNPEHSLHIVEAMKLDGSNPGIYIEAGNEDWYFGIRNDTLSLSIGNENVMSLSNTGTVIIEDSLSSQSLSAKSINIQNVLRLEPRNTVPPNPLKGDMYMDDTEDVLKVYNGTEWKSCW